MDRATGQWIDPRERPAIHDRLEPGQFPPPSTGAQGPQISIPFDAWTKQLETIEKVGQALAQLRPRFDLVSNVASAATDGSGNAYLEIYSVAQGLEAQLHRMAVNAINPSTGVPYTAASTYSAASAYLHLHGAESANANAIGGGTLIDVWPGQAGGPIFPAIYTSNGNGAPFVRGPLRFVLHVVGGPANTNVYVRYQVSLRRQMGMA